MGSIRRAFGRAGSGLIETRRKTEHGDGRVPSMLAKFGGEVNQEGLPGFDDAHDVQQVIDAVLQSAVDGKRVRVTNTNTNI